MNDHHRRLLPSIEHEEDNPREIVNICYLGASESHSEPSAVRPNFRGLDIHYTTLVELPCYLPLSDSWVRWPQKVGNRMDRLDWETEGGKQHGV